MSQPALVRQLGTVSTTAIVVSNMIGVGIFTSTGFLAGPLGSPSLVIGIWFVGALLASAPTIWMFARTLIEGDQHAPTTFWVGVITGVVVLIGGAAIGAAIFERSGERLMEFVETT